MIMRFLTALSRQAAAALAAVVLLAGVAQAQTAPTSTTLAAALTDSSSQYVTLSSATGLTATSTSAKTYALIDGRELVDVRAVNGAVARITRGLNGSRATAHASGASFVFGVPGFFINDDVKIGGRPGTSCTATNELLLPLYNYTNGRRYNCIGSVWMIDNGIAVLPPSACYSAVSGNATGTQGLTVAGASSTPVVQAQTSATGTNTHTYVCTLNAAAWSGQATSTVRNVSLVDVVVTYGVQGGALGTQANTLASGTLNSSTVFSTIAYPTAAAAETASTVTPVRADSGTLVITPVVASWNTATTTAGAFYTAKFAPASAFQMLTDLKHYLLTFTLQAAATTATTTNVSAVIVHFAYVPD
jgi:hypothetical protein